MKFLDRLFSKPDPSIEATLAREGELERDFAEAETRVAQLEAELAAANEEVATARSGIEQMTSLTESLAESRARSATTLQEAKEAKARVEEMNESLASQDSALKVALAEGRVASEAKEHVIATVSNAIEELTASTRESAKECCEGTAAAENIGVAADAAKGEATEAAARVAEIIEVSDAIKKVADRTRLLSLNAKIEASKAGTSGRGFGVVADEVGKLSHEATEASDRIAGIASALESSTRQVNEFIEELRETTQVVNQFSERVASASRKQEDAMISLGDQISTDREAFG